MDYTTGASSKWSVDIKARRDGHKVRVKILVSCMHVADQSINQSINPCQSMMMRCSLIGWQLGIGVLLGDSNGNGDRGFWMGTDAGVVARVIFGGFAFFLDRTKDGTCVNEKDEMVGLEIGFLGIERIGWKASRYLQGPTMIRPPRGFGKGDQRSLR